MFFSSDPNIVIYITPDSLQLYQKGVENSETLVYPKEAIDGLQIKDKPKLEDAIVDFLVKLPIKNQSVVFCLAESMINQKVFSKKEEELDTKIDSFLEKLPYGKDKVAFKKIVKGSDVQVIAINKETLEAVGDTFEKMGWEIVSVVPAFLIEIEKSSALTSDEVKAVLKKYPNAQKADFIYAETGVHADETSMEHVNSSHLVTIMLSLVVLVLIGGGVYFGLRFFNIQPEINIDWLFKKQQEEVISVEPTPSPQPTKSPEAIDNASKEFLKVNVLNGSGIRGQAATIREVLLALGYQDVDTGNAEDADGTTTTVVFSKNVSEELQQELIESLEETFNNIESSQTPDSGAFDIVITTGRPKT